MIKEFVKAWEKNKGKLEEYFRTNEQEKYSNYKDLVKLLFDIIINPEKTKYGEDFDTKNIVVIDHGDYQGTEIFILHRDTYQPGAEDYVFTHTYYGSCSGCDTLLSISGYGDELPDEDQVKDYMQLCLHLLQHCTYIGGNDEEEEDDNE